MEIKQAIKPLYEGLGPANGNRLVKEGGLAFGVGVVGWLLFPSLTFLAALALILFVFWTPRFIYRSPSLFKLVSKGLLFGPLILLGEFVVSWLWWFVGKIF